jgi:hypothetical protein
VSALKRTRRVSQGPGEHLSLPRGAAAASASGSGEDFLPPGAMALRGGQAVGADGRDLDFRVVRDPPCSCGVLMLGSLTLGLELTSPRCPWRTLSAVGGVIRSRDACRSQGPRGAAPQGQGGGPGVQAAVPA